MNLINKLRLRNVKVYQFEHINFKRIEQGYDCKVIRKESHVKFPKFTLPKGVTEAEAFKVLSYMYEQAMLEVFNENQEGLVASELAVVKVLVANLKDYGFNILGMTEDEAKKLYSWESNYKNRDISKYTKQGCDWRVDFTKKEIKQIYAKNNLVLPSVDVKAPSAEFSEIIIKK